MSLKRTLVRLAKATAREARSNPAFAAKLEAILAAQAAPAVAGPLVEAEPAAPPPALNPVATAAREGGEGLRAALAAAGLADSALRALAEAHNLDPAGQAEGLSGAALVELIVAAAARRVARDKALFDY